MVLLDHLRTLRDLLVASGPRQRGRGGGGSRGIGVHTFEKSGMTNLKFFDLNRRIINNIGRLGVITIIITP